jgi:hypothetical protein
MKAFQFLVTVEVSREQGKFAARDELATKIREALEEADPQQLEGDNEGQYNVDNWSVDDYDPPASKHNIAELIAACELLDKQYQSSPDMVMGGNLTNEPFIRIHYALHPRKKRRARKPRAQQPQPEVTQ